MFESFLLWVLKWCVIGTLVCLALLLIINGIARLIENRTGVKLIDDEEDAGTAGGYERNWDASDNGDGDGSWTPEDLEMIGEAFVCPECGDSYDGIYCENCGHSNDVPGEEELSEDDKWFDGMMATAMFDSEDEDDDEW